MHQSVRMYCSNSKPLAKFPKGRDWTIKSFKFSFMFSGMNIKYSVENGWRGRGSPPKVWSSFVQAQAISLPFYASVKKETSSCWIETATESASVDLQHLLSAANHFKMALKADKGNIYAANGLGAVCAQMGQLDQARQIFSLLRESAATLAGFVRLPDVRASVYSRACSVSSQSFVMVL
jgi:hypothetical protein